MKNIKLLAVIFDEKGFIKRQKIIYGKIYPNGGYEFSIPIQVSNGETLSITRLEQ